MDSSKLNPKYIQEYVPDNHVYLANYRISNISVLSKLKNEITEISLYDLCDSIKWIRMRAGWKVKCSLLYNRYIIERRKKFNIIPRSSNSISKVFHPFFSIRTITWLPTYKLNVYYLFTHLFLFLFYFLHGSLHNKWNKLERSKYYKTNFQQWKKGLAIKQ